MSKSIDPNNPKIVIRTATKTDVDGITMVSEQSFFGAERWSKSLIEADLADANKHYFVAEVQTDPCCTLPIDTQINIAQIDTCVVKDTCAQHVVQGTDLTNFKNKLIVGFVGYAHIVDEAHMMDIAVLPNYRGIGVAKHLLQYMQQDARLRNIVAATLEVRASNIAAKTLYLGQGYRFCGVRPHYYPDKEDAEIYWKEW